ncbi:MAG: SBBP repeat-containing protein, partial [Bryobacteraceae bacterium]
CRYRLKRGVVSLRLDNYDPRQTLVIDPALNFSTYLGGPFFDAIYAVTADSSGNLYVAGETQSGSFPGGSLPPRSSRDAWVAKLNNAGSQLLYLTYLGGSANDSARSIAVDPSGNAYVTGITASTDFPTTSGAFSTRNSGAQEAFVAKLNPLGELQYSTYLGGSGSDAALAIAIDATDAAYVAGQTGSVNFPVTAAAFQSSFQGGLSDCFVSKLNSEGSALVYSTLLGGGGLDLCAGLAIDSSHNAYITGTTYSTNFPVQAPIQSSLLGSATAFVTELNPTGSALLYSTYLGGSVFDNGTAIALDSSGAAYVVGNTSSPDFPVTPGVFETALNGTLNAFVTKILPAGSGLAYSTFIGGSASDSAQAIAIDSLNQAVIGGLTTSANFPVTNAIQPTFQGDIDAIGVVLNASGTGLVFSSFFGGAGDDRAYAVQALPSFSFFLAGLTASSNFPVAFAIQQSFAGDYDGFALSAAYGSGEAFLPLPPCRVADTRLGSGFTGAFGPPSLVGGATRNFPIQSSGCDVPATAQAYSLNITAVPHGALGYLTAWPTGSGVPIAATLNSPGGIVIANAAIVPAGTGGSISLYANDNTDVVIDINGYFAPTGAPQALEFYPVTPCRIADTRTGSGFTGSFGPPELVAEATRSFPVQQSSCGISSTAQAYSVRMTAVAPAPLGYLTTWPAGQPLPTVATLNAPNGGAVGNEAIVPAGTGGAIDVYASANTNLVIDINGYFAPPGSTGALNFYPLAPCRVADTRGNGFGGSFGPPALVGGDTRSFPMPSSGCGIPSSAHAYSLNLTAVTSSPLDYLTAWPTGQLLPVAATLNDASGVVVGNAAIVPAGTSGAINVFASNNTNLVIDIDGYFGP